MKQGNRYTIIVSIIYFICVVLLVLKYDWFINSNDFFATEGLALFQFTLNKYAFTSPYYPFGYPLLMNIISLFTRNYLLTVKLICAFSGAALLYIAYLLSFSIFKNHTYALITSMLLALNNLILFGAMGEDPDMLLSVIMLYAVYVAIKAKDNNKYWFYAGLLVGIASLIRQHGIALAGLLLPVIFIEECNHGKKGVIKAIIYLIIGSIAGALPQFLLNTIAHTNPLYSYSTQTGTVLLAKEGLDIFNPAFLKQLRGSMIITFLHHPIRFISAWAKVLYVYATKTGLMYFIIAAILLLISNKDKRKDVLSISIIVFGFLSLVSLTYYTEKGTYLPVALIYVIIIPAIGWLINVSKNRLLRIFVLVLSMFVLVLIPLKNSSSLVEHLNTLRIDNIKLSKVLTDNGMTSPMQCLTTSMNVTFFDAIHNPIHPKDFVLPQQFIISNKILFEELNIDRLKMLTTIKLFSTMGFYAPYIAPTGGIYPLDLKFRELIPEIWFTNIFNLEQVMRRFNIKFFILDAQWANAYQPLFPDVSRSLSLGPDFKLLLALPQEYIYVFELKDNQ
ncbi:MAG: hypothetical protein ACP5QW_09735 [bacterium]